MGKLSRTNDDDDGRKGVMALGRAIKVAGTFFEGAPVSVDAATACVKDGYDRCMMGGETDRFESRKAFLGRIKSRLLQEQRLC